MYRRPLKLALPGFVLAASLAITGLIGARPAAAQQAAAPAPAAPVPDEGTSDPFEDSNRAIFNFNEGVDKAVLVPVANAYRTVLPPTARDMIHNFLQNLNGPIIFANDVLQGEPRLAAETVTRTVVNSTIGLVGLFDVANQWGIPYHTNDLGITLATWGVSPGPYLMLPILGPSNPRDLAGDVADSFGDPGNIVASNHHMLWASFARGMTSGIDERSRNIESLNEIERTSLDFYATIRSLARQRRAAQIRHQKDDTPNASPLQGASALTAPVPAPTVASLPKPPAPPIVYSVQPNSVGDLQRSSMGR
ncbi:MAG TPA: VacJ family lipoprotein [Stellaceae bacterium]|nr:VacJ family lipoprotein [Stellaceae bacterium]